MLPLHHGRMLASSHFRGAAPGKYSILGYTVKAGCNYLVRL